MSLRLHVAEALPWLDSEDRVRAPANGLLLLAPDAKELLRTQPGRLAHWRFGVLREGVAPGPWARPILVGSDDGVGIRCFSVGDDAPDLFEIVKPVLGDILDCLKGAFGNPIWLIRTSPRAPPSRRAAERAPSEVRLRDGSLVPAWSTETPALNAVAVPAPLTRLFLESCWTSVDGVLGGISLDGAEQGATREVAHTRGNLAAADFGRVQAAFETTLLFENLGFEVLTRGSFAAAQELLRQHGWWDGLVIDV